VTSTTALPEPSLSIRVGAAPPRSWRRSSLALITLPWLILQFGGIFSPGLLDDVDSVYIEIAREMMLRHNYVTPYIDGIRFFDKPPLMYWLAAGSMHIFGVHDWAARLPLALGVLALLFAVYALGIRLFAAVSPAHAPDRGGLYAALAMALSIGPYLYTRFYIPDIFIALWMTLAVHLFLIALDRARNSAIALSTDKNDVMLSPNKSAVILSGARGAKSKNPEDFWATTAAGAFSTANPDAGARRISRGPLLPMLGFAAVLALNLLTKGLIGIVFPILFAILYLAFTRELPLLRKLSIIPSTLLFLAIALPWHILAALRNPAIAMPSGVGLPQKAGWAWFYLYNEHVARFLGRRIPHDYGQVPIPIFWLLLLLWLFPWAAFLPTAVIGAIKQLRDRAARSVPAVIPRNRVFIPFRLNEALRATLLWAGIILGFFTLSARQEYYHLPALPALALLVGGLLAAADDHTFSNLPFTADPLSRTLRASLYGLVPIGTLLFLVCGYFAITAPTPRPGVTLNDLLRSNPALYDLSLGHIFDLTGSAMGFFRWPLTVVALSALVLGPIQHLVRSGNAVILSEAPNGAKSKDRTFAANLLIAAAMTSTLLATHEAYIRFNPILGSKNIALAINAQKQPGDLILIDGELTSGSSLLFYTREPIFLVNGRINGPWFGSFFPDAPHVFLTDADLAHLWSGPHRIFLLTYNPTDRERFLAPSGPVLSLADSGGKTLLSNRK
jgi:4-amino-4-deoxy-L-arabinose transferase-like glycosyltransferase